jgi:hypothetical protein
MGIIGRFREMLYEREGYRGGGRISLFGMEGEKNLRKNGKM